MMDIVERLKRPVMHERYGDMEVDTFEAEERMKEAADEITRLRAENERLRDATLSVTASLVAATSLLERGGKKAAWSDKVFEQMLKDYKASVDAARAALHEGREDADG